MDKNNDLIKCIFLDIDGVMNVIPQGYDKYGGIFHDHFVKNLELLVNETNAKIIISSSWRKDGLNDIQAMWKDRGLAGDVIDVTPSLYLKKNGSIQFWNNKLDRHPTEKIHGYSIPRGCEIDYWLKNESQKFGNIINYVIIDDEKDFLFSQKDNFVQCNYLFHHIDNIEGYGLTTECTNIAIKILNK